MQQFMTCRSKSLAAGRGLQGCCRGLMLVSVVGWRCTPAQPIDKCSLLMHVSARVHLCCTAVKLAGRHRAASHEVVNAAGPCAQPHGVTDGVHCHFCTIAAPCTSCAHVLKGVTAPQPDHCSRICFACIQRL
jgi:hypothetical protein